MTFFFCFVLFWFNLFRKRNTEFSHKLCAPKREYADIANRGSSVFYDDCKLWSHLKRQYCHGAALISPVGRIKLCTHLNIIPYLKKKKTKRKQKQNNHRTVFRWCSFVTYSRTHTHTIHVNSCQFIEIDRTTDAKTNTVSASTLCCFSTVCKALLNPCIRSSEENFCNKNLIFTIGNST